MEFLPPDFTQYESHLQRAVLRTYMPGETVFAEGDPGTTMFVVLDGQLGISVQGKQVSTVKTGDLFGEMALVEEAPRSATVRTITKCKLALVDANRFTLLVKEVPNFALDVMQVMSLRLRQALKH